ncbi:xanthine dehydrogenase accessory protein XdhC [Cochlodiniinecator piscidefendens]|uniref:xanthine dehydrogenase accessory protein XdhC n=1 Tax=Cochlodiniinecator piscidefendens TaxID=2715756 RepID=UPI00140A7868|nr:xanthine dehydrogenase accessory protein XdhC [Cochlodiniinecator piscidefendens]
MSFDLESIQRAATVHGTIARILIVDAKGSVPRNPGTSMLVWENGQSGTIGGGALEYDAARKARACLTGTQNSTLTTVPLGPALGQCCGGSVTLLTEVFTSIKLKNHCEIEGYFARAIAADATPEIPTLLKQKAQHGHHAPILTQGWLSETMQHPKTPVWIYGAGHVGRAIARVISPIPGFSVTLVDISSDRMPDSLPEGTTPFLATDPPQAVRHAPPHAHHLVLTHDHALDLNLCHQILGQRFESLGLIGSATKWARFQKRLEALGHKKQKINRITCPIGNPHLGKHPQEIALGVAHSLLTEQRFGHLAEEIAS